MVFTRELERVVYHSALELDSIIGAELTLSVIFSELQRCEMWVELNASSWQVRRQGERINAWALSKKLDTRPPEAPPRTILTLHKLSLCIALGR